MSNYYLCDTCAVFHCQVSCLCDTAVGLADRKVMYDRGYGQGYDEPTNVCPDYLPLIAKPTRPTGGLEIFED